MTSRARCWFGDKVVGVVMNRDGSVMDVIKNIVD
jgi:citrate lyase subunit alpha/citrate CoA-transferase